MIKGVNKKVIEINNPDSPYFDRVILYVRPNTAKRTHGELSCEVDRYLESITKGSGSRKRKPRHVDHTIGVMVGMAILLTVVVVLILV